jgi:hypothetical protein
MAATSLTFVHVVFVSPPRARHENFFKDLFDVTRLHAILFFFRFSRSSIFFFFIGILNVSVDWLAFLHRILEIMGSKFRSVTRYPDRGHSLFCSVSQVKRRGSTRSRHSISFPINYSLIIQSFLSTLYKLSNLKCPQINQKTKRNWFGWNVPSIRTSRFKFRSRRVKYLSA